MKSPSLTRRQFVGAAAAGLGALSGCALVPRHAPLRTGRIPAHERLNVAAIGVGGRGAADLWDLREHNIVALCDVDDVRAAVSYERFPKARRFKDYRKMLDAVDSEIDVVLVATPDHTHAVIALEAIRRGKHVYCEKPLAHSIAEVRALMQAARDHKVITQLGNQGHSFETIRVFKEWIQDGAIGNVHTIHAGCQHVNSCLDQLDAVHTQRPPVPETLDWDLWLGPAARRPYHPSYAPGKWRRWTDFGCGTIGDWVCHVVDPVFWALDLGAPASVVAEVKNYDIKTQGETYPMGEIVTFEFPAKGARGPVTLKWYSGAEKIPRPAELEPRRPDPATGAVVYGDKGTITYGSHGANSVRIIPEEKMRQYQRPPKSIPRVKNHMDDFVQAVKSGKPAGSDFAYGGPLTEIALLGIIAVKMAGQKLEWDSEAMRFTNNAEANAFVTPHFRRGWRLA